MPVDLSEIAHNIEQGDDGLWRARTSSAVSYPEEGNQSCFAVEDGSFWFRHRNACLAAILKQYPPAGTFFDIGGGNGFVARAIQDAGFEVVLVEPGAAGARNARQRGIRQVVQATLEDAQFRPGSLPAVGLFDVVEHIEDDRRFLTAIGEFLKPGGRIYITVPAFQALWSDEDKAAGHWRRYTTGGLSKLLEETGYKVEFASYIFGFLPLPIWLMRTLPSRLGVGGKGEADERMRAEHGPSSTIVKRMVDYLLEGELRRLVAGKAVRAGGSCLVVGQYRG